MTTQVDNSAQEDIKTMKLYSHVDRIYNELKELGYNKGRDEACIDVEDVCKVDQYHYCGTTTIDQTIRSLPIKSTDLVLDIGSGLGGPARYIAYRTKCHVTAIELQPDLHQTAEELTRKCQLDQHVTLICGDFLNMDLDDVSGKDVIVSWLVFLHIEDKEKVLRKCLQSLKPGGKIFIEDYVRRVPLTREDERSLEEDLYCRNLPTREEYIQAAQEAGFIDIQYEDVSEPWTQFVHNRIVTYRAARERHVRVHGPNVYQEQEHFYSAVDALFTSGHVGGCKLQAQKP